MGKRILSVGLVVLATLVAPAASQDEAALKRHLEKAGAAGEAGQPEEVAKQLESALAEAEKFGPKDPRLARTLYVLGSFYDEQGEHAKAEPILRRAVSTHEAAFGPEHPSVAVVLAALGRNLAYRWQPRDADHILRRALALIEKAGQQDGPEAVGVLVSLAEADESLGWTAEAAGLLQRAVRIVERQAGAQHPALVPLLDRQAAVLRKMGRRPEAEEVETRSASLKAAVEAEAESDTAGPRYQGRTVGEWVRALAGPDRRNAFQALTQSDASAVPVLVQLLGNDATAVRMTAATGLAHVGAGGVAAVPALSTALGDRNLNVRYWSARALAAMGPAAAAAVPALSQALKTHPRTEPDLDGPPRYYKDARTAAAEALGEVGPAAAAAVPLLRAALQDEEPEVRKAAKHALKKIEGK